MRMGKHIISVNKVNEGWTVVYYAGAPVRHEEMTMRTTNLKTGAALKKPVQEVQVTHTPGIAVKTVRRRKSLRRLGVYV